MIIDQRYLGQEELKYVYERGKKRIEFHPELADKYIKIIALIPQHFSLTIFISS